MKREPSSAMGVTAFLGSAAIVAALLGTLVGVGLGKVGAAVLPTPPPPCPTQKLQATPLAGISVKIHNAAQVEGLAGSIAEALTSRGITVETVGNKAAPDLAADGAEVVIAASLKKLPQALALQQHFPQSVFLTDDDEPGTSLYLTKASPVLADSPDTRLVTLRCELEPKAPEQ